MKEYYHMTGEEVCQSVNGTLEPLTESQVKEHIAKYGRNEIETVGKKSVLQLFLEQFKDFLVIILIISAIVSGVLGDWESALVILVVITMNAVLGTVQTRKAEQSLESLKKLSGPEAKVLRNGNVVLLPSTEITVGDIVHLDAGDFIPADGRILEAATLKVDESALTGESVGVEKTTICIKGESEIALGDRTNMLYSGSFVTYGRATYIVTGIGMNTEVGKIAGMIQNAADKKTPLQVNLDQFGQKLSILILIFCGVLFGVNILQGGSAGDAFMFAVALAVAAIPEALSSIVTIVLSFGTQKMAKENAIIRKLQAVEGLGSVSVICSDKTGTLTKAQPTVVDVVSFNDMGSDELLRIAACLEEHFPHSMAKAVVTAAKEKNLVHEELHSKVEYVVAHGISSTIEGKSVIIGSSHFVFEDEKCTIPEGKEKLYEQLPGECSHLYMAINRKLAAVVCVEDPLREEAQRVIAELKSKGIKVVMMTGDSDRTAKVIASKVGVDEYFSEVLPEDKASFIEKEKADGRKVIMIGDGINDSPALSASDIGIAISDGAEIAREIADVTIGADNLEEIVVLKNLSDRLMERIHNNYRSIVGINTCLIAGGVMGIFPPTTSALLHNTSTLLISLQSMKDLLDK